jgi:uncharacterized membrane protein
VSANELLDAFFRWAHLIAGIMWIGNSMLFNWLDRNLVAPPAERRLSQGTIWMVHSGAFYEVEKKLLEPKQLPDQLHWFKWQNGFTWMTGIALLIVVYYFNDAAFLIDPSVRAMSPGAAIAISVGSLIAGWVVYDALWRVLEKQPPIATALSFVLLFGAAYFFTEVFSGRAAYIQTGVLMGTIMTGNVWMRILPSQRELIAATRAGREQDARLSQRAKARSIHNNYMTFPLLFIMISNHVPSAYGHHLRWALLVLVMVGGATVRHFMNVRYAGRMWLAPAVITGALTLTGVMVLTRVEHEATKAATHEVTFARAQEIILERCVSCHSAHPTDAIWKAAPAGVMFDTPSQIGAMVPRIKARAIDLKTMPFNNQTGMTEEERGELAKWIESGAVLQ